MTLGSNNRPENNRPENNRPEKPEPNRTQKIVMWSISGVAAVLFVVAAILVVTSGARLF